MLSIAPSRRLISSLACAAVFLLASELTLHGQDNPPTDPPSNAFSSSLSRSSSADSRDISPALLPANFLHDQENIGLFPRQLAKGHYWKPTLIVAAATFAMLSADPRVDPYFSHTAAFGGFDRVFGSKITVAETIAIPAALYFVGLENRDS